MIFKYVLVKIPVLFDPWMCQYSLFLCLFVICMIINYFSTVLHYTLSFVLCAFVFSYVHRNISMRFLTCEPNLKSVTNYTDEADQFYQDPGEWLHKEYTKLKRPWPSLIVYFNSLQKDVSRVLVQGGYHQCESFFHTHIPDGRVGSHVLVSCR